jgi:hypothetical protein
MLLDDLLESLQLTHKNKPAAAITGYSTQDLGSATLDQLDDAALEKFADFRGIASQADLPFALPDSLKKGVDQTTLNLCGDDKFARRIRLSIGDDSNYGDDASAADFALACDLLQEGFEASDVEVIMRATRYREKFDSMRGDTTYLARTITNAIGSVAQGISTPSEQPALSLEQGRISIPTTPPPPRDYVWQGRMVAGHAYALGGFGGVSKSQAALQFAASITMGAQFGNVGTKKGSALLIFGEDDVGEISLRIGAYTVHEKLSATQLGEIEKNIRALGLVGDDTRLTAMTKGALENTKFSEKIIAAAIELAEQSEEPIRLIVLDHAGLFHGGDFNAREDVSLTMRIINHIAHQTGAAVLLLAHSPKSAANNESSDTSAIAGSTTFVDQTRGAFILATMRKSEAKALGITETMRQQYVSMAVVKSNYGKIGEVSWFTRTSPPGWEVGVLVPADLQPPVKNATPNAGASSRINQFIADHPGQYSKTALRDKRSGKDGELKASKPEVAAAIEDMLAAGELITRQPTEDERNRFGLPHQMTGVLDVPAKRKVS